MNRNDQNKPLCGDEKPFHVVLIDLQHAAHHSVIRCVEKPLTDKDDLNFVAISYRWGEVQETTVDTGVGYLATVTSFDLNDFFNICRMIAEEDDLWSMGYVWVDAICVNQTNREQRKATIYHMTDIYERANYILAVPDLHLRYLQESSKYLREIISFEYDEYIYHLILGNIQNLFAYDQEFMDKIGVPTNNPQLRRLLTHYTEYFTTGLATCCKTKYEYCCSKYPQKEALQHIYEISSNNIRPHLSSIINDNDDSNTLANINKLHTCQNWMHYIPERSETIRRFMGFLMDLVMDWSSRAWVVSEFHIAKNKSNKMKYWFIQIESFGGDLSNPFFTFDFDDAFLFSTCGGGRQAAVTDTTICHVTGETNHTSENVFHAFHSMMRQQLTQQTFLEKMLKSKASKHEDRFHAILPSSEYKSILNDKDSADHWHNNINTLVDVKLELYKWMTTKHKLELLFLASYANITRKVLPSFATTSIQWPDPALYPTFTAMDDPVFPGNFDLGSLSTIQLIPHHQGKSSSSYKLNVKPREYYRLVKEASYREEDCIFSGLLALKLIDHDDDDHDPDSYDFIVIPNSIKQAFKNYSQVKRDSEMKYCVIVLAGYMATNKWVLVDVYSIVHTTFIVMISDSGDHEDWKLFQCDENNPGFDIY